MRIKFYYKLITSYLLVVILPIASLSFYNSIIERKAALSDQVEMLKNSSRKMASDIDKYIGSNKNIIRHLAINSNVIQFLDSRDIKNVDEFNQWLRSQTAVSSDYEAIFILDMGGNCVASSESAFINQNYLIRDYFYKSSKGITYKSDWSIGLTSNDPGIYLSTPVMHENAVIGVIVLKLRVAQIITMISYWNQQSKEAFLINGDGVILTHTNPLLNYSSLGALPDATTRRINEDKQFSDKKIQQLDLGQLNEAVKLAISKHTTELVHYTFENSHKIAALTPLDDERWVVCIAMSESEIDTIFMNIVRNSIVFTIISLIACLAIGLFMSRFISRPILKLTDTVNQFGNGRFDIRAVVQSDDEIGLLATSFNHMADALTEQTNILEEKVCNRTRELECLNEELKALSVRDPLTGCFNRRFLLEKLDAEIARAKRYGHCLAVILCDLDHFKAINDTYGHQAGDEVLKSVSQIMFKAMREKVDWLIRYGGEEFLLILPETNLDGARVLAERLRGAFENFHYVMRDGRQVRCTASFGTTAVDFAQLDMEVAPEMIFAVADELLYLAKDSGRNRVFSKDFMALSRREAL